MSHMSGHANGRELTNTTFMIKSSVIHGQRICLEELDRSCMSLCEPNVSEINLLLGCLRRTVHLIRALKSFIGDHADDVSPLILPDLPTFDYKSRNKASMFLIYSTSCQCVPFD